MGKKKNYAYVDGSFNPKTKVYGYGGFLVDQYGKKHILQGSGKEANAAKMRNVAGELLGAAAAMTKAFSLGMKKLTIYHDYEGVAKWALGSWRCNKNETRDYKRFAQRMMSSGLKIYFEHVRGHSGNKLNDMADRLAKEAVGIIVEGGKK